MWATRPYSIKICVSNCLNSCTLLIVLHERNVRIETVTVGIYVVLRKQRFDSIPTHVSSGRTAPANLRSYVHPTYSATMPFPSETVWSNRFVCWPENFGKTVEAEIRASIGDKIFDLIKMEVCKEFDSVGDLNKAALYIGSLLTIARQNEAHCPSLDRVCEWINAFGAPSSPIKSIA
jgi:hypothetical protein